MFLYSLCLNNHLIKNKNESIEKVIFRPFALYIVDFTCLNRFNIFIT